MSKIFAKAGTPYYQRVDGPKVDNLKEDTVFEILADDGTWYRVADKMWFKAAMVKPYTPPATPPPVEPPPVEPPQTGRVFGIVKHDGQMYHDKDGNPLGRPEIIDAPETAKGLPETQKLSDFVPVEKAWQFLWYECFKRRLPADWDEGDRIHLFGVVTRRNAFKTNQHACENGYANYITGCNNGAKALRTEVIVTGGAYLELLDHGRKVQHGGKLCYMAAMLNITKPITDARAKIADWDGIHQHPYIYFATTSLRGGRAYPLLGGTDIAIINIAEADFAYIDCSLVDVLPEGAPAPSPYWP